MIDFFFAVLAAGINSADGANRDVAAATPVPEAPAVAAPAETAPAPAETIAEAPTVTAPTVPTPAIPTPDVPAPAIPTPTNPSVIIGESAVIGSGVIIGGAALLDGTEAEIAQPTAPAAPTTAAAAPAQSPFNMTVVPAGLVAEPQNPSGKFTTAAEVKPILNATKGNWVAVREYNGQDLLYVTHLWGWRCGLSAMAISVNGEAMQNWPLPPCHMKYTTPNAVLEDDGLPYLTMRLGSVQTISIQIVYDDLTMDVAQFERGNVLIP